MEDYDLSVLYLPPKKWDGRAEEWYDQVDNISKHVREQIAQEIEAFGILGEDDREVVEMFFRIRESFAAIARGKK